SFYSGGTIRRLGTLAEGANQGFSILRFLNCARLFDLVYRVYPGAGPRSALSSEPFAAFSVTGFMVLSKHAKRPRPSGVRSLRLLSERAHGTHHSGVVGQPDGFGPVVPDLFGLHSVHHFCYSLSSIPLYGRPAGRDPDGSGFDSDGAHFVPK